MKDLPTIKDVAQRAGVGIATVSRVLNERASISPETRARVLAAVKELGYKPNQMARNMVTQSSRTLGLIIPDIRQSLFPELARGFEDEAQHSGYGVILADTDEDLRREQAYVNMLLENRVAGIALTGTATPASLVRQLHAQGMPVVSVNPKHQDIGVDVAWVDFFQGTYLAMQHLLELGHRRIAHLAAPRGTQAGLDITEGYFRALREHQIEPDPALVIAGSFFEEHGYRHTGPLIHEHPDVTAIFAAGDLIAVGAVKALKEAGLSCPGDISVVGFTDLKEATIIEPELTTVSTNPYLLGRTLAQQLIGRIHRVEDSPKAVEVPYRLIVRQSTAPPR